MPSIYDDRGPCINEGPKTLQQVPSLNGSAVNLVSVQLVPLWQLLNRLFATMGRWLRDNIDWRRCRRIWVIKHLAATKQLTGPCVSPNFLVLRCL